MTPKQFVLSLLSETDNYRTHNGQREHYNKATGFWEPINRPISKVDPAFIPRRINPDTGVGEPTHTLADWKKLSPQQRVKLQKPVAETTTAGGLGASVESPMLMTFKREPLVDKPKKKKKPLDPPKPTF